MALGALIGAYVEDDFGRLARPASARRANLGRISGALRRRRRRGAGPGAGRARPPGAPGCVRAASDRGYWRISGQRCPRGGEPIRSGLDDPRHRRRHRASRRARRAARRRARIRSSRPFPTTTPMRCSSESTIRSRWAGIAVIDGELLASTARMLGDWDLQSTLLRRAIQEGAVRTPVSAGMVPVLAEEPGQLAEFQRGLLAGSRVERGDAASRYVLPPVEDWATGQLIESQVRPEWLLWAVLGLTLAAAVAFLRGWIGVGIGLSDRLDPARPCRGRGSRRSGCARYPRAIGRAGRCGRSRGWRCSRSAGGNGATAPGGVRWSTALSAAAFAHAAVLERDIPPATGTCGCSRAATRSSSLCRSPCSAPGPLYLLALTGLFGGLFFPRPEAPPSTSRLTRN